MRFTYENCELCSKKLTDLADKFKSLYEENLEILDEYIEENRVFDKNVRIMTIKISIYAELFYIASNINLYTNRAISVYGDFKKAYRSRNEKKLEEVNANLIKVINHPLHDKLW